MNRVEKLVTVKCNVELSSAFIVLVHDFKDVVAVLTLLRLEFVDRRVVNVLYLVDCDNGHDRHVEAEAAVHVLKQVFIERQGLVACEFESIRLL